MIEHDEANEKHRERCTDCAAVWDELERISAAARVLPTLSPSRDLWAGIEARLSPGLEGGGRALTGRAGVLTSGGRSRWLALRAVRLAAAAALLVATTATVTWRLAVRDSNGAPPAALASGGSATSPQELALDGTDDGRDRLASYERDFGTMTDEIRALEAVLATQSGRLEPATITVIERNLALIDRAITESRAAFIQDPASRFLAVQLTRSYSSKLSLLRDLAMLPSGT